MKDIICLTLLMFSLTACSQTPENTSFKAETLLSQNEDEVIWGFDFMKDGTVVFTERSGALYTFDPKTKKATKISGTPKVYAVGQGGLLDVRVHPSNGYIYLTWSEPVGENKSTTSFGRGKLSGDKLTEFKKLFTADFTNDEDIHYGSRIEFDGKGHVFVSIGERGQRMTVQKLDNHLGKMIRLKEDGSVPKDNPYVGQKNAKPENWSLGLRSPQGLQMRPGTDELWLADMGPRGGDEINIMKPKANYGWPVITYGREYYGPRIGEGTSKEGMEQPIVYWVPSISPSGMAFYTGDKIPEWKGNVFFGLLSGEHVRRLELEGNKVIKQEELLKDLGWRFRQVRSGPDGYMWFSTDNGKLGRIIRK